MLIQSLSIVVPTKRCVNDCPFCVSKMHSSEYVSDMYVPDDVYINKLNFARDNGCNTLMITGTAEPMQNREFLKRIALINNSLDMPFRWIEFQTTGVYLTIENLGLLQEVGVSTISLSVSDIFDNENNLSIMEVPNKLRFFLPDITKRIKKYGFNIRLSLNMTSVYNNLTVQRKETPEKIFIRAKALQADQVTFRVMYVEDSVNAGTWLLENNVNPKLLENIKRYIINYGKPLEVLPFGETRYSLRGMSTVVDNDCMNTTVNKDIKYLILRPNGKLYTKWNDEGSLLF